MRTIKFRRVFKNRLTGEISFAYWGFIDTEDKPVHDFSIFKSPAHNNQCNIISDDQFTDKFDEDGAEIYEGDICIDLITNRKYPIVFEHMGFFLKDLKTGGVHFEFNRIKVIGNIHDK